jgi:DMSO/TMAO reductase YedYZ heme-binding membrane subunit
MVTLSIPLLITANRASMRALGRYWRTIQAGGTYAIWAILGVHLALLEGFGYARPAEVGVPHQRLYEFAACTLPLVILRLPPVRRWYRHRDAGHGRAVYTIATTVLVALFLAGMVTFANELLFKGLAAWHLTPIND